MLFWILGWFFTIMGVLGNGSTIFLIVTRQRLHTTANLFIASLAVADLCAVLTYFPLIFVSNFYHKLNLSHAGWIYKPMFMFLYCSTTNLCVMTADRYFAITKPLRYTVFMTRNLIAFLVFLAWLTPLLLFALPAMFAYRNNETYTLIVETSRVMIFQVAPSVIFVFVTGSLVYIARQMARQTAALVAQVRFNHGSGDVAMNHNSSHNSNSEKRGSMAMVILVISLFNIAHIGVNYRCFCFITKVCVLGQGFLRKVVHSMIILNSVANPIAYALLKKDIRKELLKMFKR